MIVIPFSVRVLCRRPASGIRTAAVDTRGLGLLYTVIAIALLAIVATFVLSGLGTSTDASVDNEHRVIAESLVRSQIEYVRNANYQYSASEYPVDATLAVPEGWEIPPSQVEPVHASDDGLQKVTVTALYHDEPVIAFTIYKADR